MTGNDKVTVTSVIREVFEHDISVGQEFSGLDFKKLCVRKVPAFAFKYEDTFLRILRHHYREQFVCVSRSKSIYKKIGVSK